jgi:hypothetical protein
MICACHGCNNEVPYDLERVHSNTCSPKCRTNHNINNRAKARARRIGKEARLCEKCNMYFTDFNSKECICYRCKGLKPRNTGKNKEVDCKYDPYSGGNGGKYYKDFRLKICNCNGEGPLCGDYSQCSDTLATHKHGAFKYQTNGNINCYEAPATVNRVNYGNSLGVCSENR